MGPIVLESISPVVRGGGAVTDVHLMVENPAKYFEPVAKAGGDSVTFHYEAVDDVPATIAAARAHGLGAGVAFSPETEPEDVSSGCAPHCPTGCTSRWTAGWGSRTSASCGSAAPRCSSPRRRSSTATTSPRPTAGSPTPCRERLPRARARGCRAQARVPEAD